MSPDNNDEQTEKVLFKYSLASYFIIGLVILLVFAGLTMLSLVTVGAIAGLLFIYSMMMLAGILFMYRSYFLKARSGKFSEYKFRAKGWKFDKTFDYSELKSVSIMRGVLGSVLTVEVVDQVIHIYKNPQSNSWDTDLRSDLFTFLKEKADQNESLEKQPKT